MSLGITTVVVGGLAYRATHPGIPDEIVSEARGESVDPAQLNDIYNIESALFHKSSVSSADWGRLKAYADGHNLVFKAQITRHLWKAQGTPYQAEAHAMVSAAVTNSDPFTRAAALISLRRYQDPSWRSVANGFLQDPDKFVRGVATRALQLPVPGT